MALRYQEIAADHMAEVVKASTRSSPATKVAA